jgi:hypothetical protein
MAVGGVAGEEQAAVAKARRDDLVHFPFGDPLDPERHVGIADRAADARPHLVLVELAGEPAVAGEDRAPFGPRLHAGPDAEDVLAARAADEEQRPGAVRRVARQVGLDPDRNRADAARLTLEREVALLRDDAARAVATDGVARPHLEILAAAAPAHAGDHVVGRLADCDHLVVEAHVGAAGARRVEQDRLEHVLGRVAHRARARRFVLRPPIVARAPRHHARQLAAGEGGGEDLLAHEALRQSAAHHPLLDAEIAEDLHRPLVGDVGPR